MPESFAAIQTASVLAALVARYLLGNELELALQVLECRIGSPLLELPLYLLPGACSGLVAVVFSQTAKLVMSVSDGDAGPEWMRSSVGVLPAPFQPILGGLICSAVSYGFPQILYFGYETLNSLLRNNDLSTELLLSFLAAQDIYDCRVRWKWSRWRNSCSVLVPWGCGRWRLSQHCGRSIPTSPLGDNSQGRDSSWTNLYGQANTDPVRTKL